MPKSYQYDKNGEYQSRFNVRVKKGPQPANDIVRTIAESYVIPETGKLIQLAPHQIRILNHVFSLVKNENGDMALPYKTIIYSCPKKEGKTEIAGAVGYSCARNWGGDLYSIANDIRQAEERAFTRIDNMLAWIQKNDPDRYKKEILDRTKYRIEFQDPYARIDAISCDPRGEAGGKPTVTLWDELWGYDQNKAFDLWAEMVPVPTVKYSIRFVTTYAGWYGRSRLLWELYEKVCKPNPDGDECGEKIKGLEDLPCYVYDDIFVYWDHENRMPWKTKLWMEGALRDPSMRPGERRRLWENRWTTDTEAFLPIELFDKAVELGKRYGIKKAGIL